MRTFCTPPGSEFVGDMQSSGNVVLRTVVMLGTLVTIPVAALFRDELPGMADKLLASCQRGWSWRLSRGDEARFERGHNLTMLSEAPRFEACPEFAAGGAVAAGSPRGWGGSFDQGSMAAAVRISHEEPLSKEPGRELPDQEAGGRPSVGSDGASGAGFRGIEARLRELGASYYLLESWGSETLRYRFHCRMAIGGNSAYARQFESISDDPLQAMNDVLRQVEAWCARRE